MKKSLCLNLSSIWATALLLGGCAGFASPATSPSTLQPFNAPVALRRHAPLSTKWPVSHLIVVMQQQRTFDDLFAGYPGADAPTYGYASTGSGEKKVSLKPVPLKAAACRLLLKYTHYFDVAWNDGKMDGWNKLDKRHPLCPYTRVIRSDVAPYWRLARKFAIADHMFSSTRFSSFANQLYIIAATSKISKNTFVIGPNQAAEFGCASPPGTKTSVLKDGRVLLMGGPFPCFDQFPTIANLLDQATIPWRFYYSPPDWNVFSTIQYVAEGADWSTNMSSPATNVLSDISNGNLAAISWVRSPFANSDAPGTSAGPAWVDAIVHAVQQSAYWNDTAVVVTWIDPGDGNFYDDAAPPQLDAMGLGFRVPLVVASRYAKRHYVSHTQYEYASILKFIEENWNLPLLGGGATDKRANSLADMFAF